jgi:hypothetical protein
LAARVVVDRPGQCIFNPHPCTIGSASGGRASSRARVSLSSEVVNRQSSLRAQPLGGRAMGGWRAKRAGVSGAKPLTARNPEGITLSALLDVYAEGMTNVLRGTRKTSRSQICLQQVNATPCA